MELRNEKGQTEAEFLAEYDSTAYEHPSVTVDVVAFTLDDNYSPRLLLVRRRNHPHIGKLATPGGFVEMDEDVPCSAARELFEETGVDNAALIESGVFGKVDRDPRSRNIGISYAAILPMGSKPIAGDDAASAELYPISLTANGQNIIVHIGDISYTMAPVHTSLDVRYECVGENELAFDHAEVIFRGLATLAALNRDRICAQLFAEQQERARQAVCEFFDIF